MPVRELKGHLSRAARVDQPYDATLTLPDHFDVDPGAEIAGLTRLGLTFDPVTARFSGTPHTAGTHEIRIPGHWRANRAVVVVDLPVTPDPFSLWQDIPSDPSGRYARPDAVHAAAAGDLTLLMASRRGRKHANTGAYRDDDAGIVVTDAGWHIGVAADGAGSAPLSREGARLAVATVLADLPDALANAAPDNDASIASAVIGAARAAAEAVTTEARATGDAPGDFATTLIIGAARRTETGWLCVTFSVGDGLAAIWDAEAGTVERMIAADSGEFAGQTRFLDADLLADPATCAPRLFVARPERFTAICLMTDGVSDAQFPTAQTETDPAHWTSLWTDEIAPLLDATPDAAAANLCDWLDFRVPGEHDDRSLVLMLPQVR